MLKLRYGIIILIINLCLHSVILQDTHGSLAGLVDSAVGCKNRCHLLQSILSPSFYGCQGRESIESSQIYLFSTFHKTHCFTVALLLLYAFINALFFKCMLKG